jgi:thiamine biosynthesis lipoprotein
MSSNHARDHWVEEHFPAMGSHAHIALRGTAEDMQWAQREIQRLEYRWSADYGCSDVARCNRAAGRSEVAVAGETLELLDTAIAWWRATDGWFDPTAHHAEPAPGCGRIVVDHATNTVFLPDGVGIDLGGIGKGAAADRVVAGLAARGVVAACVSLGGDVRAYGSGHDGAIVTSTSGRRHRSPCDRRTHLVDPATGRAADTGLAAVVVTDHSTARAEALATAAFVAGRERGADLLARFGVDGLFIPLDTAA